MQNVRLVLLFLLASPAVAQTTIHVPGDQPTIQAGISAAVDGDTVLVAPGTYVEQIDFLGKAITVRSSGGAAVTAIDSQGAAAWTDFPIGPVVRMVNGEGVGSVLQGFTVTGSDLPPAAPPGYTGIWCVGLSPTIRDCVVAGNSGAVGGGVFGDPLLEDCVIEGNDSMPYGDGGGVYGSPTIVRCVIANNRSGGRGGGILATAPCTITDSVIDRNLAGNGSDGYTGGGVYGPATIAGCQITRNGAHHYLSGGPPDTLGTAVDGAAALVNCTIADNFVVNDPFSGPDPSGAVRNVPVIENCIVWNNEWNQIVGPLTGSVTYSIVEGGFPGVGNLASDPLFVGAGDYHLQATSPAIDAGNPGSPPDPDGTVADMGAYFFPQFPASFTVHNGTGVNPLSYTTATLPVLGTTWTGMLDASLHPSASSLGVMVGTPSPDAILATPFGELLIAPGPFVVHLAAPVVSGFAAFQVPIPASTSLSGVTVHTQAAAVGSTLGLTNAIDLSLGL